MTADPDYAAPQALDAERYVLGALILSGDTLEDCGRLTAADFYHPAHAALWDLLTGMHAAGEPTEVQAVADRLRTAPIRGMDPAGLTGLTEFVVPTNAGYYARIVRDRSELRAVQRAGMRMLQAAAASESADDAKTAARAVLDGLDEDRGGDTGMVRVGSIVDAVIERVTSGRPTGLSTPWPDIDDYIVGLKAGAVYTIGARTGLGKSVLAGQIAWHVAHRHGLPALLYSLEMPAEDITERLITSVAGVDYARLQKNNLDAEEWDRVARARASLADAPLDILDRSSLRVSEVRRETRRAARRGPLGVVVVDYVQLMTPTDRKAPREQQVAECSRDLKVLAGDLKVPVVMVSQLNRAVESRQDKRPHLSDLRESGALEQDSDVVLLLHREDDSDDLVVGVAKNRGGPLGPVHLRWEGKHQRAVSAAWTSRGALP